MEPSSTSALAIKIALAIIGPILLATAAVTILLSVKQGKQDDEISAMVEDVKAAGSAVKDRFSAQFEVSASVALDRLRDLGNDFVLNIIDYMAAQMSSQRQRGKDR